MQKKDELYKKILFTLGILLIYRIGSFITIPGINPTLIIEFAKQNQTGFIGMLNIFSGGSICRLSIFALAIYPYITSSIVVQLLSFIYPSIKELNKQGEVGKNKINQITKYLTIFIATFQAYALAASINLINISGQGVVAVEDNLIFKLSTVITLVSGTMILIWLSGRISAKGIGNGSSLIICTGIMSAMPQNFLNIFELSRTGAISAISVIVLFTVILLCVLTIIFVEQSFRKIPIQYPKQSHFLMQQQNKTYLPFKINISGVMPPIFTNTIILGPIALGNFLSSKSKIIAFLTQHLSHGKLAFFALSAAGMFFFSFFYNFNALNLQETTNNLQKYGAYIPGIRPGKDTESYLKKVISKLTILGSIYLCIICIIPEIFVTSFNIKIALSTTSLLIVISVLLDLIEKIQTHDMESKYGALMAKKIKVRIKR
jgi:preprotein translocase subunit SecY